MGGEVSRFASMRDRLCSAYSKFYSICSVMGVVIKESIISSFYSYIGIGIGTVNALFLYTYFLSPEDLGLVRIIPEIALIYSTFAQLGAPYIASRFFPSFRGNEQTQPYFVIYTLLVASVGFLVFALFYLFFHDWLLSFYLERAGAIVDYHWILMPFTLVYILINMVETYVRNNLNITLSNFLREVFLKLGATLLILLYGYQWISLTAFLWYFLSLHLVVFYVLYRRLQKTDFFKFSLRSKWWTISQKREMFQYGVLIIIGSFGLLIITKIDMLMLPALAGLSATGIYSTAIFFATVIEVPKRSINQIVLPILINAESQGDRQKIHELYQKSAMNGLIAGMILFCLIAFNLDSLFEFIPKKEIYSTGKWVIILLGLSKLMDMATGISYEIMAYSKYYKMMFVMLLFIGIFSFAGNYWLIPPYGINGAAAATLMATMVFCFIRIIMVKRLFQVTPFSKQMGKLTMLFVILCLIYTLTQGYLKGLHPLLSMAIWGSYTLVFLVGGIYWLKVSVEANAVIDRSIVEALKLLRLSK